MLSANKIKNNRQYSTPPVKIIYKPQYKKEKKVDAYTNRVLRFYSHFCFKQNAVGDPILFENARGMWVENCA